MLQNSSYLLQNQSILPLIRELPVGHLYHMLNSTRQHASPIIAGIDQPGIALPLSSVGLGLIFAIFIIFVIYKLKCTKNLHVLNRDRRAQETKPTDEPKSLTKLFVTGQQMQLEDSAV